MSVEIDDTDSAIVYSGSWSALTGSSRQYQSTVHSTTQSGASATIKFHGTRIIVYQTVPMGDGTETVNSNLDGNSGSISRHSHSDTAYYQDTWFDSGPITLGDHTLVVSNGGGASDTPFQLDRFHIEGDVIRPATGPNSLAGSASAPKTVTTTAVLTTTEGVSSRSSSLSASSSASASTSILSTNSTSILTATQSSQTPGEEKTVTAIQYVTTSASTGSLTTSTPDRTASATSEGTPMAAIIGGVIGFLALLVLLLLIFCLRRRRRRRRISVRPEHSRRATDVTPYDLENNASRRSLMRNASREMSNAPNSRSLAISTLIPDLQRSASERNPGGSPNAGTSDTNHSSSSEKNRDLFSNWTSQTSDIYTNTAPIMEATSPSSDRITSPQSDDTLLRPRYLSGDTLTAPPNHVFGPNALGPIDSNDIPPSYQSVRSRNSNLPAR